MDVIIKTVSILKLGGIVIFPTDTAYGIGCRIDSPETVERLFTLRRRDPGKAVPVLVSDPEMAYRYWQKDFPEKHNKLVQKYWPGALTIIYPKADLDIHKNITGGGNSLGIREPDHKDLRQIIRSIGVPIIGTSANFPGEKTPHQLNEIAPGLINKVDFVLDLPAGVGESTVIDLAGGVKIVRQGNVRIDL